MKIARSGCHRPTPDTARRRRPLVRGPGEDGSDLPPRLRVSRTTLAGDIMASSPSSLAGAGPAAGGQSNAMKSKPQVAKHRVQLPM